MMIQRIASTRNLGIYLIVLGDFNAKVGIPTTGIRVYMKSVMNDTGVRVVKFATSKKAHITTFMNTL
jgi:hypothetical protein